MAVNIRFLADVVNLVKGLSTSKEAIGDNADALEDVMRKAIELGLQMGKTSDQIARDVSSASGVPFDRMLRAVEEVERASHDLADAQEDAGDAAEEAARKTSDAADGAARKTGSIKDKAGEVAGGLSELGSIAKDVLSGDFGSAADGALSTLTGLASAVGIGGAVGGAVSSAIQGLVGGMVEQFQKLSEQTEKVKADIIADFIDLGDGLDKAAVDQRIKNIFNDPETRKQADLLKQLLGTDLPTAALIMAGDFETAGIAADKVHDAIQNAGSDVDLDVWGKLQATMEGVTQGLQDGATYQEAYKEATNRTKDAAKDATASVQSLWDLVRNPPKDPKITVGVDTSQAERDWNAFKNRVSGTTIRVRGSIVAPDGRQLLQ